MNVYVYGTGCGAGELVDSVLPAEKISAFVESEAAADSFLGRPVITPEELAERDYDLVIVTSRRAEEIAQRCEELGIDADKLFFLKNSFFLSDRNRCTETAGALLGEAYVERLRASQRLIRAPLWSEREALPETELDNDYVRLKTLEAICRRLEKVPGATAELGVYRGGFAKCINALLPDRTLYLFDSFSGFAEAETAGCGEGFLAAHRNTAAERVFSILPHPERAVIRAGLFPETARDLEERYALVSLDVDLEESTLAGLRFFVPRMEPGGCLLLHDYNNPRLPGVKAALERYEEERGERLQAVPLCDVNGSLVICL